MKKICLVLTLIILNSCNVASIVTGTEETDLGDNFKLDVRDSLLVFWRFEEGKDVDKVDSENNIVLVDTALTGFDKVSGPTRSAGTAVDCSSTGSGSGYFETAGFPYGLNASTTDLNISFWMKPYLSASATVTTILENPGNNISFTQLVSPDRLDMQITIGGGVIAVNGLIEANDFNNWVHISFNIAGRNLDVYKNGNFYGTYGFAASGSSSSTFILCSGTSGLQPHNGYLDSFGIWERTLDEKEIEALYNGNNNVD